MKALPAWHLPWFRALHSYVLSWLAIQPTAVRDRLFLSMGTAEAFTEALLSGEAELTFDTDRDANTTDVYVHVTDDEGTSHVLGYVRSEALGLPTPEHVVAGLAAAGWSLNPSAEVPDDPRDLTGGDE